MGRKTKDERKDLLATRWHRGRRERPETEEGKEADQEEEEEEGKRGEEDSPVVVSLVSR